MLETNLAKPFLVVYIIWHPDFAGGAGLAEILRGHFRRELYQNVAGGTGLSVIFRSEPLPKTGKPLPINFSESETTAVLILAESCMANDPEWGTYLRELSTQSEIAGLGTHLFPIAIDGEGLNLGLEEQALRWDQWIQDGSNDTANLHIRLISELTYEFCRMLRHYLEHLKQPEKDEDELLNYLKKVQIFLSHSKHDKDGERIAHLIREQLHSGHGLSSFFDVQDIPAGLRFHQVLLKQLAQSAVVAIHTDSYSSREWCRREIIEAKRNSVPLVVANCISELDERGFPYMGNVPIVRMDPQQAERINIIIARLLDEVLKDFLWRCRIQLVNTEQSAVQFVPRAPELISLAGLKFHGIGQPTIVYPDPPLSSEEERLFEEVKPGIRLRSFTEWLAEGTS
ncbi:toll/interleukin-1 receptor domain-containing protein [Serratia nevei]|uniref:toll/interleukin-1 receptor domain-containing protein n=1 Tax=Serratia nevei TaxID=2703794 RepID=UPI0018D6E4AD|nr:toll/interleukin-1 receptor domain-containing protein [Serratia marcescens]MBI6127914.1 toll/interleukin-1 receptor domain-containing protein [Serratia marcescens]MBN5301823.1 toll/interleukin-1 receptor domain-containing protein [Serratia marcescens]